MNTETRTALLEELAAIRRNALTTPVPKNLTEVAVLAQDTARRRRREHEILDKLFGEPGGKE